MDKESPDPQWCPQAGDPYAAEWVGSECGWHRRERTSLIEKAAGRPWPSGKPAWTIRSGSLAASAWRERYEALDEEAVEELGPFRSRTVTMWIGDCRLGTVASAAFTEWRCDDPSAGMDDFAYWSDAHGQEAQELAHAVSGQWAVVTPFDYGTVAVFEKLVIASRLDPGRQAWPMLRRMVAREFGKRAAILYLKAFPLEFSGRCGSLDYQKLLTRRRGAMMAHYRRNLGAEPVPGAAGDDGWMWRAIRACPPRAPRPPRRSVAPG